MDRCMGKCMGEFIGIVAGKRQQYEKTCGNINVQLYP